MSSLSYISLGGIGSVTKNMYVYEYGGDILIVDCGIGFPDSNMLGVDLLIPDVSYLQKNLHKIKGMLLTHGHEDHIGAVPYVLDNLSNTKHGLPQFPIYGTKLTAALTNSKLEEFGISKKVQTIGFDDRLTIGAFSVEPIRVTHSILDTTHYLIHTPIGTFYHGSDFKLDPTPVDGKPTEMEKIRLAGKKGILCLSLDALRSEKEGRTPSEQMIEENFEREIKECKGKFIVTTYSSNISRLNQAIRVARRNGRKVCFIGRSLENARDVALKLGYLDFKREDEIRADQVKNFPRTKVALLVAGSQGQENSALTRISNDEDKYITIQEDDMIIFSADPIPGNEVAVHSVVDTLSKRGARVVYSEISDDMHVSGHAAKDELRDMISLIKPRFLIPIGATYRQMVQFRILAQEMGYKKNDILLVDAGQEIIFDGQNATLGKKVPIKNVYVDELTGSEIHSFVLRDRKKLSEDGIVVIIVEVEASTGFIVGEPDVITRGFVTEDEKWLKSGMKKEIRRSLPHKERKITDWNFIKRKIEEGIEQFVFKKTRRRPLILPIVLEV